ncbi:MAG: TerC family protein [Armatimonadota bacterium]|nr:TerC family protein [Armatimonadota bacterium]MDR7404624.1 TerC family protein [Armatimonadota bacterium]
MSSVGTPWLWAGFSLLIAGLLALDLGVFHRRAHEIRPREALAWSVVWIALALLWGAGVWWRFGPERGLEYLTGYLIEKALSVDNIFVFLVIFSYFGVPAEAQHRVLFWGIVGAVAFRMVFILAGAALLAAFHWTIYLFGAVLVITGIRMLRGREPEVHPERHPVIRWLKRRLPLVARYHGGRFAVREAGRLRATPLVLALVTVELSDILFAADSIPAIFAVTRDPFIVYTSNIFAILGLRALYFLLAGLLARLRYLHVGLGLVLVFVGIKMVLAEVAPIPIGLSLLVVAGLIGTAAAASVVRPEVRAPAGGGASAAPPPDVPHPDAPRS